MPADYWRSERIDVIRR